MFMNFEFPFCEKVIENSIEKNEYVIMYIDAIFILFHISNDLLLDTVFCIIYKYRVTGPFVY